MYNIQEAAYGALVKSNAKSLPIDMLEFTLEGFSWVTIPLSKAVQKGIVTGDLREYAEAYDGCTIVFPSGRIVVIYKDSLSYTERNQVLAHEVGHIVLKHTAFGGILGKSSDPNIEDQQEKEANYFSPALLAPLRLLADDGITDPAYIEKVTHVPLETAITIAGELQEYKKTRKTKMEKALSKKFQTHAYKRYRLINCLLFGVCVFALAATLLIFWQSVDNANQGAINKPEIHTIDVDDRKNYIVYTTPSGQKFHRLTCSEVINRIDVDTTEMTIEDAWDRGYGPCKKCNPLD